jgi:hypothetical protein
MRFDRTFARNLILIVALTFSTEAMAQKSSVNFKISFAGQVDCDQPFRMQNVPIRGDGTGVLNQDGSITADVTQTAFILSTTIHFAGRLGAPPTPAPGGTAQARVAGRNNLRLIWNLPNNQLIVHIAVQGQSCSARFEPKLFPGKSQYTLFDGRVYHYCGRPRVEQSSCQVQ